jgi:hypothetical protein
MAGLEHSFLRKILKRKFTFSNELFDNEIKFVWKRHGKFLQERFKKDCSQNGQPMPNKHYMYVVPIIRRADGGYELDV